MKFAYLILCHKNPEQINQLINILDNGSDDIYVHSDIKFPDQDKIRKGEHVFFTKKRIDVKWGHYSQITATLELLNCLVDTGKQYDYIWFLSGQDFPIKSYAEMALFIENNRGKEFLEIDMAEKEIKWRMELYYLDFVFKKTPFWENITKYYYIFCRKFHVKRRHLGMPLYKGSQWFTISMDCAKYIVDYIKKNPDYYKAFKYTFCGDEVFFITLIKNSPFGNYIENTNLREIIWTGGNNPKTLTIQDYDHLLRSPNFFARKFDLDVDAEVIRQLQDKVLKM